MSGPIVWLQIRWRVLRFSKNTIRARSEPPGISGFFLGTPPPPIRRQNIPPTLLGDPIFDDPIACSGITRPVARGSAHEPPPWSQAHEQRGREWGINELVLSLYPKVVRDYERLHQASNDVRYHEGLRGTVGEIVATYASFVVECSASGLSPRVRD